MDTTVRECEAVKENVPVRPGSGAKGLRAGEKECAGFHESLERFETTWDGSEDGDSDMDWVGMSLLLDQGEQYYSTTLHPLKV